ncbi:hypothetical protein CL617_03240 [archaeon]|nr:hypothetical protein [archaeon]|tara:strand:+ start:3405 stop:3719 length:315 start_codon:yes stop_codon:yes gene_type:complete
MGKNKDLEELTNLLSKALRHRIGSIVNENELYADKYAKDAEVLFKEAEKVILRQNWNSYDKTKIKEKLKPKLKKELEQKDFLDNKKFDIMDHEINRTLKEFNLI